MNDGDDTDLLTDDVVNDPLSEAFQVIFPILVSNPAIIGDAEEVGAGFDLSKSKVESIEKLLAEPRRLVLVPSCDARHLLENEFGDTQPHRGKDSERCCRR